jgi:hypothetical protein
MAAATSPASCDRPPVSDTIAVRGGLAFTGNAPMRPVLPTPTPTKSRSTSGGSLGSDTNDRVVAAVCTMMTVAMMRVRGTSRTHRPTVMSGIASVGSATETFPRTATPRLSSRINTTAAAAQRATRANRTQPQGRDLRQRSELWLNRRRRTGSGCFRRRQMPANPPEMRKIRSEGETPSQPRRRHLLRTCDSGKRETGDEIVR